MSDIELLKSHIQHLKRELNQTPANMVALSGSITADIEYYENQLNLLLEES